MHANTVLFESHCVCPRSLMISHKHKRQQTTNIPRQLQRQLPGEAIRKRGHFVSRPEGPNLLGRATQVNQPTR